MLNIPENIKELFRVDNSSRETWRRLRLRFYDGKVMLLYPEGELFPSEGLFPIDDTPMLVIEGDQIPQESLVIEQALCASESLRFGECNADMVEITVADVLADVTGKEFALSVEVGGYELMLGIYKVDSFERQADRRLKQIVAYDRMRLFQVDVAAWYHGLSFPMSLKDFRDSLCAYVGITQTETRLPLDEMEIAKTVDPAQLYGLDVMRAICEINGCFGRMDVTGRLRYVTLEAASLFPSETLFPDEKLFPAQMEGETLSHYREADYEDYLVYGIEKVIIRQEEGDVGASYGDGTNAYTIQGNLLVYGKSEAELCAIAEKTYEQISGRTYRPCTITTAALPWVELGDGLICYTTDDVIETYCLKRTLKGIQAMMDTYEATGTQERHDDFGVGTQIIQLEGKAAVIKKSVEEVSVRVEDLKAFTEAQLEITANQILAEVKRAQEAEAALTVRADQITASVKSLKEETEAEFRVTAEQISAEVKRAKDAEGRLSVRADEIELSVKDTTRNLQNQITVNQNGITTISANGWISSRIEQDPTKIKFTANKLIVDSTNFKLDGNGDATFSGTVSGASIVGGTINIGGGIFEVDNNGSVAINSGEIDFGNVFYVSDEYLYMGDYKISNNETNIFRSKDESISMQTAEGGPFGYYAMLQLKSQSGTTKLMDHGLSTGAISATSLDVNRSGARTYIGARGIETKKIYITERQDFWDDWSLTDEIILLHNKVFGTDY